MKEEDYSGCHLQLPNKKHIIHRCPAVDTGSEDIKPDGSRILGKNYTSQFPVETEYANNEADAAISVELGRIAATDPTVTPHSCSDCEAWEIDFHHGRFIRKTHPGILNRDMIQELTVQYAKEKAELGCPFFQRILRIQFPSLTIISEGLKEADTARVFTNKHAPNTIFQITWSGPEGREFGETYEVYTPYGSRPPAGTHISRFPPNLVPNSELSFSRVKGWINDCSRNHTKCKSEIKDFMPTRVLHISGTDEKPTVRLSTDHPTAPYATLSYCWGGAQPAMTTQDNLQSYLADIPFSSLPSTIQDAAIVTRGIGLSYLWVDAMCIIQDDDNDKLEQITQMHAIYRGSKLTIAAAEAVTSNDGFLQPRGLWQPVKMAARFDDNVISDVLLVPSGVSCRQEAPLFQRGWTMQETLLSTRVLIYGLRELTFLCLDGHQSEGGAPSTVRDYQMFFDPGSNIYVELEHPESWAYLVSAYSQRLLSVEEDKLLGIAALAETYGRKKGINGYVAGMWTDSLLEQCLWTTETYGAKGSLVRCPEQYRAPSWSWASLDGHISSFGVSANMPAVMQPEQMPSNITCQVIDVQTTLTAQESPFGSVTDGYMIVRGKMRRLIWHNQKERWMRTGCLARDVENTQKADNGVVVDARMDIKIDHPQEWTEKGDVSLWSMEICNEENGRGYALLLRESEHHSGSFKRVGRLDITERDSMGNWFESEHEYREVTII